MTDAKMTRSEIYRRAAEIMFINKGDYGTCRSLNEVDAEISRESALFSNLFYRDALDYGHDNFGVAWTGYWFDNISRDSIVQDECRVLALLFAAAMAETGDI